MAFEIGQVSHGYQFIEVLKSQGHGVAYKVRNQLADRLETLKALSRELQKDKERVQRFLREVKIHAHLSHPHMATFYNAFEIDGEIVMTAELVEGVSLEDLLADGPIPVFKAAEYASQTLDALEYTHANGVIHRNITPKSLVVASNENIKVGEFELARSESDPRLTLTGMVMGPMHYISPEQVKGLEDVDGRGDVYSFGMVFYELITGRKPFDSDNQFDVMQAHVNLLPEPPSQLNTELLPEVDETLFKALAKDRQHRYQSAGEFRHALDNLLPARRGRPLSWTVPRRRPSRRYPPSGLTRALRSLLWHPPRHRRKQLRLLRSPRRPRTTRCSIPKLSTPGLSDSVCSLSS